ncbi:hypothetical protein EASAB2608_06550 [Streptomyces sp. EAS-AB2608]|nr:hypothetical protein EASAB2608_06550 [Streptomyces sp. EAS-AB2608]
MAPSPWKRRRKHRHTRLRMPLPCPLCVTDTLEHAIGPAGQLLLMPQPVHWSNAAGCALLVLLRLAGRPCPHNATTTEHPEPGNVRPDDTSPREATDAA